MIINIFGSTGMIGSKTLDIISNYFPQIKINLLCSNSNVKKLIHQIETYSPKYVYLNDSKKIDFLKQNIKKDINILNFNELKSYLVNSKSDLTLLAISGYRSLNYLESILTISSICLIEIQIKILLRLPVLYILSVFYGKI